MKLSYIMRIRIVSTMAIGVVLLGLGGWRLVAPADPKTAFTCLAGSVSILDVVICVLLASLAGLASFLVCAPFGHHIAPVAAPAGLAAWALRSAPMAALLQSCATITQRNAIYKGLIFEGFLWLALIAGSLGAIYIAQHITSKKLCPTEDCLTHKSCFYRHLRSLGAVILSAIIAYIFMGIFAQDVKMPDARLGWLIGQPAVGQIAFAVIAAFALAGFFSKAVLNSHYIWSTASTAIVSLYVMSSSASSEDASVLMSSWPASFFLTSTAAILPIQIIAFGSLGAFLGYWLGLRYLYWRKRKV